MNCDQVFDILTCGPFPRGRRDDGAVELHLTGCHECRQLAEALRPAVDLLHETLQPGEERRLPAYQGRLGRPGRHSLSASVAAAIEADRPPWPGRATPRPGALLEAVGTWPLAAVALLLLALAGWLWNLQQDQHPSPLARGDQRSPVTSGPGERPDQPQAWLLSQLDLPAACQQPAGPDRAASAGADLSVRPSASGGAPAAQQYHCCTQCHAAANAHRPKVQPVALLTNHCASCHTP